MVGAGAWSSDPDAWNGYLPQNRLELRAVTIVARSQQEREGPTVSVGGEMDFGGQSAAGASQALAEATTSSSRTASLRRTGSVCFVAARAPF